MRTTLRAGDERGVSGVLTLTLRGPLAETIEIDGFTPDRLAVGRRGDPHPGDAVGLLDNPSHLIQLRKIGHIDVRDLVIGDREVRVTNLEKVYFPESGITKLEIARYYEAVAPLMLPHLRSRKGQWLLALLVLRPWDGDSAGSRHCRRSIHCSVSGPSGRGICWRRSSGSPGNVGCVNCVIWLPLPTAGRNHRASRRRDFCGTTRGCPDPNCRSRSWRTAARSTGR